MSGNVRRNVRLRQEYLYRKSLQGAEAQTFERKRKLKAAIESGKSIPTELRYAETQLRSEMDAEDDRTAEDPSKLIDDEYASAGVSDPKVCLTTARDPSSRLKQFAKELKRVFPNSVRINRGSYKNGDLVEACQRNDFTDLLVVQETRGEPDGLLVCHLPLGPCAFFSISNCVLRHDIEARGTISEAFPHLLFEGFNSALGERTCNVLRHLFPVPRPETKRVMTFANDSDYISFRHHTYEKPKRGNGGEGGKDIVLRECGPRFEMKLYKLRLGTIDQEEAENEWVLRPYMNTAKKRKAMG